jgi:tRNA (cmo5U34)-methyltransferase
LDNDTVESLSERVLKKEHELLVETLKMISEEKIKLLPKVVLKKPEEMSDFFDIRASSYEDHMRQTIVSFDDFYSCISKPIEYSEEKIKILDLGCGTGLEINWILKKAPNAYITGVDVSAEMLEVLKNNYKDNLYQITIIKTSYTDFKFEKNTYDYIISVMTMHHLLFTEKRNLYKQIKRALKKGGKYIEGDYSVSIEKERQFLKEYETKIKDIEFSSENLYHIDIPFSLETQKTYLGRADLKNLS